MKISNNIHFIVIIPLLTLLFISTAQAFDQYVKLQVIWEGGIQPFDIQAHIKFLNSSNQVVGEMDLEPNENLTCWVNTYENLPSTATQYKIT